MKKGAWGLGVHLLGSRQHTLAFYGFIFIVDMSNNSASPMPRRIELGQVYGIRPRPFLVLYQKSQADCTAGSLKVPGLVLSRLHNVMFSQLQGK